MRVFYFLRIAIALSAILFTNGIYEAHAGKAETSIEHSQESSEISGEEKAGLPQLDPKWFPSQIFWLLVTFFLLHIAFSRKVLPDISSTLENRREQIQSDLDSAEDLKEKAEEAHHRYEDLMGGAYQKSREISQKNEDELKKKYNEFMEDFRQRSSNQLLELEKELTSIKSQAKKEMHDVAAELARDAAKKIAGIEADKAYTKSILNSIEKKAA